MYSKHNKSIPELSSVQIELISSCSQVCQTVGLPKSIGQIYGFLFLAKDPHSLDDMGRILGISKASISTGIRRFVAWGAIKQVWIQGRRRDYYEAILDFGALIRRGYTDFVKPKLLSSGRRLKSIYSQLEEERSAGLLSEETYKLYIERLKSISHIQNKIETMLPLAERFL